MNREKNKKGMTLVEVIIALVLATAILVIFLNTIIFVARSFDDTKRITNNAFGVLESVELDAHNVRNWIVDGEDMAAKPTGSLGDFEQKNIVLFASEGDIYTTDVTYYLVEGKSAGHSYVTYVASIPDVSTPLPKLTAVLDELDNKALVGWGNKFEKVGGETQAERQIRMGYYNAENLVAITPEYDKTDKGYANLGETVYDWYASDVGFNIPVSNINAWNQKYNNVNLFEGYFPQFPGSYKLMAPKGKTHGGLFNDPENEFNKNKPFNTQFIGRQIAVNATPVTKDDLRGMSMQSNPELVFGLPVLNGLVAHYDASTIINNPNHKYEDNMYLTPNSTGTVDLSVKKMRNLANIDIGDMEPSQGRVNAPEIVLALTGELDSVIGEAGETPKKVNSHVQSLELRQNNGPGLRASVPDLNAEAHETAFAVVRSTGTNHDNAIFSHGTLPTISSNFIFGLDFIEVNYDRIIVNPKIIKDDKWHILSANTNFNFFIDSKDALPHFPAIDNEVSIIDEDIFLGYDNVSGKASNELDFVELIVYNRILSAGETDAVNDYLHNKYGIPKI